MGGRLSMHGEIHSWLSGLRSADPQRARLVGEAVLATLDAGRSLGPPLVVPLESVFRPPDDPREALDFSYQRQLDTLQMVRRSVADVATARKRIELQVGQLEQSAAKLARQRQAALDAGRADLASEAQARTAAIQEQLPDHRGRLSILAGEEQKLTAASQRLQAKVDAFRTQKETIKATYAAAQASQAVRDAFASIGEDATDLEDTDAESIASSAIASATTVADEILQEARDLSPIPRDGAMASDQDGILPPPGMMELRPGAPDNVRVGLLYMVEPHGAATEPERTIVMLAWVEDPGGSPDDYHEAMQLATARLALAGPSSAPAPSASGAGFFSYDADSFLDEFFPGEEAEVELGAAALVARSRAHTLAEARQRIGLTQAQVAERMNIRQERVSAIERAEPGATEVRTLAAYVRALGGRLEIVADLGAERVLLR
jgi:phage shock protein A/DNA-binding XRE family transcriptional regulator